MWQGSITDTRINGNKLEIYVSYTNGENNFDDVISTDIPQPDYWLKDQITARLTQLNDLSDFQQTILTDKTLSSTFSLDNSSEIVLNNLLEK